MSHKRKRTCATSLCVQVATRLENSVSACKAYLGKALIQVEQHILQLQDVESSAFAVRASFGVVVSLAALALGMLC